MTGFLTDKTIKHEIVGETIDVEDMLEINHNHKTRNI